MLFRSQSCGKCHSPEKWSSVKFNHDVTKFALLGKHKTQGCRKCHFKKENNKTVQEFSGLTNDCINCHKDEHNKQFASNGVTDCILCHAFDNWKAVNFDHNNTLFPLDGSHIKVACNKCHKKVVQDNVTFVQYKIKEFKCENCH